MPEKDDKTNDLDRWLILGRKAIGYLKKIDFGKQLANPNEHLVKEFIESLHKDVLHSMRDFAIDLVSCGDAHEEQAFLSARALCTASSKTMGKIAGLSPNQIHCCLKGFNKNDSGIDEVVTWARSEPLDARPVGIDDAHPVDGNTVWCALLGCNDGRMSWRPYSCFASNDLQSYSEYFKCSRDSWPTYYKSVLVYPLRYFRKTDRKHTTIGFLAFDSPNKNAFTKIPDIFKYKDTGSDWGEYHDRLNNSATFHIGAAIADTLSIVMRPFYEIDKPAIIKMHARGEKHVKESY